MEDISGIDMRWLALLFIVLAYGCLLGWTEDEGAEGIRDRDEGAKTWYWAARRAIMSSPTFHGVSLYSFIACILFGIVWKARLLITRSSLRFPLLVASIHRNHST